MPGYPKWIYWLQGVVFTVGLLANSLLLCLLVLLSAVWGPIGYAIYWKNKPVSTPQPPVVECTEEDADRNRQAYMEAMPDEERSEIDETIRLVNE